MLLFFLRGELPLSRGALFGPLGDFGGFGKWFFRRLTNFTARRSIPVISLAQSCWGIMWCVLGLQCYQPLVSHDPPSKFSANSQKRTCQNRQNYKVLQPQLVP